MNTEPLSFRLKLAFGVGQAAEGLKNAAFGTFLMFYYNQVLGMPGALAGTAVGLAVIIDSPWIAMTAAIAVFVTDRYVIVREERKLKNTFGQDYRDYLAQVRRWL